ncbi:MAG: peptidoglycan-associated lipoprotein Pal [Candidatus Omnitrophica bacterium]|nr:peptidoglycan-associated lipoprotein Pal [Candidatus Omnitrophota bacterium]MCM8777361.1 peptidoglycan-associated lipoprotein Pal [Candidatus Omnitrophota bacterium]
MRLWKIGVVFSVVGFLAGCQTPKKKPAVEEKEERPSAVTLVTPSEKTPETDTTKGKATPEEVAKAIKDEPIPPAKIAEGKVFVAPSEISEELAKIFQNIHFDFDKYEIRQDARPILNTIGKYLLGHPEMEILIEGHCDERGTREYNLVLGEQRALSTRRYLVSLGVSPKRLHTVSYGEDKPLDTASNEEAWAKNRRAEFKIAK